MDFPGNIGDMLKKAQELQQNVQSMQDEVAKKEVDSSAGGGMVVARVNGKQEVVALTIDPSVVNPEDIEMLQDLVRAAVNEGVRKSKDLLKDELSKITGGLPIPGLG